MRSALIAGTSRGLGTSRRLRFLVPGFRVHARMRNPSSAPALSHMAREPGAFIASGGNRPGL
jgi:NAD(P)-dependent dehydrogenase (short-subunit alcohol dehydrogenase family)